MLASWSAWNNFTMWICIISPMLYKIICGIIRAKGILVQFHFKAIHTDYNGKGINSLQVCLSNSRYCELWIVWDRKHDIGE